MLISILCIFSACEKSDYENLSELSSSPATEEAAKLPNEKIGVYVCGEVMSPGIYYFEANSRIKDAIEAAGGVTVKASLDSMNLAEYLNDCDKIHKIYSYFHTKYGSDISEHYYIRFAFLQNAGVFS